MERSPLPTPDKIKRLFFILAGRHGSQPAKTPPVALWPLVYAPKAPQDRWRKNRTGRWKSDERPSLAYSLPNSGSGAAFNSPQISVVPEVSIQRVSRHAHASLVTHHLKCVQTSACWPSAAGQDQAPWQGTRCPKTSPVLGGNQRCGHPCLGSPMQMAGKSTLGGTQASGTA